MLSFKVIMSKIFYYLGGVYFIKLYMKNSSTLVVLNYHHFNKYYFDKSASYFDTLSNNNFTEQLIYLDKHFSIISPESFFHDNSQHPGLNIALTFDDGYHDNFSHALPALSKAGIDKCCFFVTTGCIESPTYLWHDIARIASSYGITNPKEVEAKLNDVNTGKIFDKDFFYRIEKQLKSKNLPPLMMNWEQVTVLHSSGFTIGSHTVNHLPLIFYNYNKQYEEIEESISHIETEIPIRCNHFAYPNGLYNQDSMNILKEKGIEYGYTTQAGINNIATNKLEIKRLGINSFDTKGLVLLKIMRAIFK